MDGFITSKQLQRHLRGSLLLFFLPPASRQQQKGQERSGTLADESKEQKDASEVDSQNECVCNYSHKRTEKTLVRLHKKKTWRLTGGTVSERLLLGFRMKKSQKTRKDLLISYCDCRQISGPKSRFKIRLPAKTNTHNRP